MTNLELTDRQQIIVLVALKAWHRTAVETRELAGSHPSGLAGVPPEMFAQWADDADRDLSEIDAIVAQFPDYLRAAWDLVAEAGVR